MKATKRNRQPYVRKGARHPFLVRGTFYHHLRLGVRITFERAYGLSNDMKYVVICKGKIVGYAFSESAIEAERIFDEIARAAVEPSPNASDHTDKPLVTTESEIDHESGGAFRGKGC